MKSARPLFGERMAEPVIEVRGLKELAARMQNYPREMNKALLIGIRASLTVLHEKVPPYPPQPKDTTYRRTGTLGRTLGSSMSGGKAGSPSVYQIRKLGSTGIEGRFGTNLDYAPYVIGDTTQSRHMSHWWKLSKVAKDAQEKILHIWVGIAEKMAAFIDGKGL